MSHASEYVFVVDKEILGSADDAPIDINKKLAAQTPEVPTSATPSATEATEQAGGNVKLVVFAVLAIAAIGGIYYIVRKKIQT